MHLKSIGYPDTVLFPTIGKEGNVLLPYIGKSVIYCRKVQVVAANFIKYWSTGIKNLLPTYLNFLVIDIRFIIS
jgi:hypothetical protein